jgi:predicted permease
VRQALGAAGLRLFRQIVTESVVLSALGGIAGTALAYGLVRVFVAVTPERFSGPVEIDLRALLAAALICIGTGFLTGLAPALQARGVSMLHALGAGVVGARRTGGALRRWIVAPQIAVTLVLALVAATHVRALRDVQQRDLGYQMRGGAVLDVARSTAEKTAAEPPGRPSGGTDARGQRARQFLRAVLDASAAAPGADVFAFASSLPFASPLENSRFADADAVRRGATALVPVTTARVSDRYFEAMGMRMLEGRAFRAADGEYDEFRERVAVVSASAARSLGSSAVIGRRVTLVPNGRKPETFQIVGVTNDIDPVLEDGREHPFIYVSIHQEQMPMPSLLIVRARGDIGPAIAAARHAVTRADSSAEVTRVRTLDEMAAEILYPRRLGASILVMAGLVGLLLACIGVYGVVAYSAAQREREMGIRSTLGATRAHILTLVLREGVLVVGIGVTAGAATAVVVLRATEGLVAGVPSFDVAAFAGVPAVLALVVLAASLLPALRASRVDPAVVLRGE